MTDIIERLKEPKLEDTSMGEMTREASPLELDAAYEIERLRAKNVQIAWSRNAWKKQACRRQDYRNAELEELLTENERLRAELHDLAEAIDQVLVVSELNACALCGSPFLSETCGDCDGCGNILDGSEPIDCANCLCGESK
jgi:hypothetical protein